MWRHLTAADGDDSVHLANWPAADADHIDRRLEEEMALARRLTSLGRAARSEAGMKVRQPLRRALVFLPSGSPEILRDVVADELNVDEVDTADELSDVIQFELAANFRTLGPRLGERAKGLKSALAELEGTEAADALESGRTISVMLDGESVDLGPEDVSLRARPQQGFAVSREGGEVVALDLSVDDDLRRRGWARDVVRQVQDLRKTSGLEVSDRIILRVVGLDAVTDQLGWIAGEVLATDVRTEAGQGDGTVIELEDFGDGPQPRVWLEKDRGDRT
jgi:isoleucyl-tRNA synthetase